MLLPSFATYCDSTSVAVNYRLRVVIERPRLLQCNRSATKSIEFHPLLSHVKSWTPQLIPWKVASRFDAAALELDRKETEDENGLPCYSPSVLFEVTSPASLTLRPGDPVQIGIAFVIPTELRVNFSQIWLLGLAIRLKTRTAVNLKGHTRSSIGYVDVCSITGLLSFALAGDASRIDFPSELLKHRLYPLVAPSFQLCGATRSHQLEVVVDFAHSSTKKLQVRYIPT